MKRIALHHDLASSREVLCDLCRHARGIAGTALFCLLVFAAQGHAQTVDFETPHLDASEGRRIVDPYVDPGTGVIFTVEPGCCAHGDEVVGVVKNALTSACVPPSDDNQKLGTGRSVDPGSIGLAAFPIRATFASPLPAPATVSVEFQTRAGTFVHMKLYSEIGTVVGEALAVVPDMGTCVAGRAPSGRVTLTATSLGTRPVAWVALTVDGGLVWVIDDFSFTPGLVPTRPTTWSRVKSLYGMH